MSEERIAEYQQASLRVACRQNIEGLGDHLRRARLYCESPSCAYTRLDGSRWCAYHARCTVHASPDCEEPHGYQHTGIGWGHDDSDPRIECAACAAYLAR